MNNYSNALNADLVMATCQLENLSSVQTCLVIDDLSLTRQVCTVGFQPLIIKSVCTSVSDTYERWYKFLMGLKYLVLLLRVFLKEH